MSEKSKAEETVADVAKLLKPVGLCAKQVAHDLAKTGANVKGPGFVMNPVSLGEAIGVPSRLAPILHRSFPTPQAVATTSKVIGRLGVSLALVKAGMEFHAGKYEDGVATVVGTAASVMVCTALAPAITPVGSALAGAVVGYAAEKATHGLIWAGKYAWEVTKQGVDKMVAVYRDVKARLGYDDGAMKDWLSQQAEERRVDHKQLQLLTRHLESWYDERASSESRAMFDEIMSTVYKGAMTPVELCTSAASTMLLDASIASCARDEADSRQAADLQTLLASDHVTADERAALMEAQRADEECRRQAAQVREALEAAEQRQRVEKETADEEKRRAESQLEQQQEAERMRRAHQQSSQAAVVKQ
jgi:hypothetical protein